MFCFTVSVSAVARDLMLLFVLLCMKIRIKMAYQNPGNTWSEKALGNPVGLFCTICAVCSLLNGVPCGFRSSLHRLWVVFLFSYSVIYILKSWSCTLLSKKSCDTMTVKQCPFSFLPLFDAKIYAGATPIFFDPSFKHAYCMPRY